MNMKFAAVFVFTLLLPPLASAYHKGFNVAANNPDGSCKTQAQWEYTFKQLAGLPGSFKDVRLFASSDCNTLTNAVPAAIATGTKILAGVWTEDDAHYAAEKLALEAAINAHGSDWLIAVSVGSEDLYRGDMDAGTLARKINDVRNMLSHLGVGRQVGHTDTWTAWVDSANSDVIKASDFICNDAYPYWQGVDASAGYETLETAINRVRGAVKNIKPDTSVWLCETGWPVSGQNFGNSVPSVANAATYWNNVACKAFKEGHVFWYSYQDYNSAPSFGVVGSDGKTVYDLSC